MKHNECLLRLVVEDGKEMSVIKGAVLGFAYSCTSWARMCKSGLPAANQAQTAAWLRVARETKLAAAECWYTDLRMLRSCRSQLGDNNGYQSLVNSWVAFGKAFGLKETVERDRYEYDARKKHICSWTLCEFHLQPSPTPLFTCAGCGEQRYCSRACQKRYNIFLLHILSGSSKQF